MHTHIFHYFKVHYDVEVPVWFPSMGQNYKVNEECNLKVGFDDTFKGDSHVFSIVLRANRMSGWMVRNLISRETNILLRLHLEYCTQAWASVSRHGNWCVIMRLKDIQKRVRKIIKRVKDYIYRERLYKLGLTTLLERRMRSDLMESF